MSTENVFVPLDEFKRACNKSEPGAQARPGSWPPPPGPWGQQQFVGGAGPTVNIPDTRFGYTSPIPNMYSQVS